MRAVGEQLLSLAQRLQDSALLLEAHHGLWTSLFSSGELAEARAHQAQGLRLYDPQRHRTHATLQSGHDSGVCCHYRAAPALWLLGYPNQAVASSQAAVALAQQLARPVSLGLALYWAAIVHHLRWEAPLTQARAEAAMAIATDQGFPHTVAQVLPLRGWALAACGKQGEGTQAAPAGAGRQALDVARRQEAKSLALRAAVSLSRLWQQQGKPAEARALLAPIYTWFTEGFDTADLQDAQTVLEELAG